MGRVEDALKLYLQILEVNPADVETLLITGHICVGLQKFEDAKEFYVKVLDIDPGNSDARQNLDKLPKAANGIDAPSQSVEEMYQAAQKAASGGREQEAIKALEDILAASPEHAHAHNDLGVLSYKAGDKSLALDHYKIAAQLDPHNATFQKNLADYYCIELSQFETAMQIYVKILEHHPEDVETLMAIGYICESLNKLDDARAFYQQVLEIEPWNLDARQKQDALNSAMMTT